VAGHEKMTKRDFIVSNSAHSSSGTGAVATTAPVVIATIYELDRTERGQGAMRLLPPSHLAMRSITWLLLSRYRLPPGADPEGDGRVHPHRQI